MPASSICPASCRVNARMHWKRLLCTCSACCLNAFAVGVTQTILMLSSTLHAVALCHCSLPSLSSTCCHSRLPPPHRSLPVLACLPCPACLTFLAVACCPPFLARPPSSAAPIACRPTSLARPASPARPPIACPCLSPSSLTPSPRLLVLPPLPPLSPPPSLVFLSCPPPPCLHCLLPFFSCLAPLAC